jgi:hypothetical protein
MKRSTFVLCVKTGCPWYALAQESLGRHGFQYEPVDVSQRPPALYKIKRVSGPTGASTRDTTEKVDFGLEELAEYLRELKALGASDGVTLLSPRAVGWSRLV